MSLGGPTNPLPGVGKLRNPPTPNPQPPTPPPQYIATTQLFRALWGLLWPRLGLISFILTKKKYAGPFWRCGVLFTGWGLPKMGFSYPLGEGGVGEMTQKSLQIDVFLRPG